jgi:hypothetical protein
MDLQDTLADLEIVFSQSMAKLKLELESPGEGASLGSVEKAVNILEKIYGLKSKLGIKEEAAKAVSSKVTRMPRIPRKLRA